MSLRFETMRDFFLHYAVLTGILFFVGRLHVFPSLADALVAGLLATATVAVVLLALDRALGAAPELPQATQPTPAETPSTQRDA